MRRRHKPEAPLLYLSASMETLQDAKDKKNLLVMPRTIAVLAGVLPEARTLIYCSFYKKY